MMMKRIIFTLIVLMLLATYTEAQHTSGGIPWSISKNIGSNTDIVPIKAPTPDYEGVARKDMEDQSGRYRIGILEDVSVGLNDGTFNYLPDGNIIWRCAIQIDGALATDLYYDKFYFPKGVSYFLSNKEDNQILGSFNYLNNPSDGIYTTSLIEGNIVYLELDIDKSVSIDSIQFHVNRIGSKYRGGMVEEIQKVYGDNKGGVKAKPTDFSQECEINAVCPPEGTDYAYLKKSSAYIDMGAFLCSGNLINNTNMDCAPLLLTASHCEETSSMDSTNPFNTWKFYFNFEYPNCNGSGTAPLNDVVVGAKLVARAPYNVNSSAIIGDFLLLRLKDEFNDLGNSYDAYFAGWDRDSIIYDNDAHYIDFHHPSGDPTKLTVFKYMQSNGIFNGGSPSSHWKAIMDKGGIEHGSSGSAIISMTTGRIWGDLSGGADGTSACDTSIPSLFSKICRNWVYPQGDGTEKTRLKEHLDPANTGVMGIGPAKVHADSEPCELYPVAVSNINKELDDATYIYPNPTNGLLNIKTNFKTPKDLSLLVYDVMGKQVQRYKVRQIMNTGASIDLSTCPNGVYYIQINAGNAVTYKKVILSR